MPTTAVEIITSIPEHRLATPNYSYEKRQRELAKKRKTEEKRQRKQHGDTSPQHPGQPELNSTAGESGQLHPGDGSTPA